MTSGTGGTAVLNADGTVTFTPDANFNGAANFSYTVSDGDLTSAPATATINVTPVNDAPVNTVPPPTEQPLTVAEDTDLSITGLLISDVDAGSANTITTTLSVLHGTLSVGGDVVDGAGSSTTKREYGDPDRHGGADQCNAGHRGLSRRAGLHRL